MRISKLIEDMRVALVFEAIVTTVSSFLFYLLSQPEMILLSIGIGLMIGYITWAIPLKVKLEIENTLENQKVKFEILEAFTEVKKKEYFDIRDEILQDSVRALRKLAEGKIYDYWYYEWLITATRETDSRLVAVSNMLEEMWWKIPNEMRYYRENVNVRKSGTYVERIFLSSPGRLREKDNRKIILMHLLGGLNIHIVLEEWITNKELRSRVGEGFTIFEKKDGTTLLFVDEMCPPAFAGGQIKATGIDIYKNTYHQLKQEVRKSPVKLLEEYASQQNLEQELDEIFKEMTGETPFDFQKKISDKMKVPKEDKETFSRLKNIKAELKGYA